MTEEAVQIVKAQEGSHPALVFTYKDHPVRWIHNSAWRSALKRAGIQNFRWHDQRHTWATLHAQAGTPMYVLQELGGWSSLQMVRRYAHFTAEHVASHVEQFRKRVKLNS